MSKGNREASNKAPVGRVRTFLGKAQESDNQEYDELRRSPYLLLRPGAYDHLSVRVFMLILRALQVSASFAITIMFLGSMVYGFFFTVSTLYGWLTDLIGI